MKKFWIVVGPARIALKAYQEDEEENNGIVGPNFTSELDAIKIAEYFAIKHPDDEYYIMELVKCSKAEVKATTSG